MNAASPRATARLSTGPADAEVLDHDHHRLDHGVDGVLGQPQLLGRLDSSRSGRGATEDRIHRGRRRSDRQDRVTVDECGLDRPGHDGLPRRRDRLAVHDHEVDGEVRSDTLHLVGQARRARPGQRHRRGRNRSTHQGHGEHARQDHEHRADQDPEEDPAATALHELPAGDQADAARHGPPPPRAEGGP